MESLKIIFLCILAAVVYGILHDQVTARVCVEYFTIAHPPVFHTTSPTLLAIGWGIIATWWVGLILGIPAALISRLGSWPKFTAGRLFRPMLILMIVTALASLLAGIVGYLLAKAGRLELHGRLAARAPVDCHDRLFADGFAHMTAYGVGSVGGLVLCVCVLFWRWRMARSDCSMKTSG